MQTLKNLISKIKFDKREDPKDYELFYIDRIKNKKIKIKFTDIKHIEGGMFTIIKSGRETEIPLHRIRLVTRKGEIIWKR
ncbi:DUF504 domain-containing protein [Candidatus Woesearchaeota archaeon]|nr:DUF504 domain-containing protein [Candidatus Woesearchaeota archaeon]MBW3022350.1 DUF504 domain-containing protein [Candidatus Woesearchaeota archaeon]